MLVDRWPILMSQTGRSPVLTRQRKSANNSRMF